MWTLSPGVPIGCRSPRKQGPYSTPIHSLVDKLAKAKGVTPGQIAIAWLLKRSPVMLPTPGTSRVKHLDENVAAASITLSEDEFAELDAVSRA